MQIMNGYDLSKEFFDWCYENPEEINPTHIALYFFIIEHSNRLGWKDKFGLPTQMAMDAIGVKNWRTYKKAFDDLVKFGFISVVQKSKNQYSANVIAIVKNTKANTKAYTKALQKHIQKQSSSTYSSTAHIDKLINKELINQEQENKENIKRKNFDFDFSEIPNDYWQAIENWLEYKASKGQKYKVQQSFKLMANNLIKLSGNNPVMAQKIVEQSMANNWSGLFELKNGHPTAEPQSIKPVNPAFPKETLEDYNFRQSLNISEFERQSVPIESLRLAHKEGVIQCK